MRGDENGRIAVVVGDDGPEDEIARRRIDAADRLIEQVERRPARHDEHELDLLLRALRQGPHRRSRGNRKTHQHILGKPTIEVGIEIGEERKRIAHFRRRAEIRPLRQVGNPRLRGRPGFLAENVGGARRRLQKPCDELDERGFAAAVRPEQSDHAPAGNRERHRVEGDRASIALGQHSAIEHCGERRIG